MSEWQQGVLGILMGIGYSLVVFGLLELLSSITKKDITSIAFPIILSVTVVALLLYLIWMIK